jgi:hypothetical protein
MGRVYSVFAAVMLIASLAGSSAFAYDKHNSLIPMFNMTTCGQYAEDRKLPKGVGMNGSDMLYVAGFLSAANVYVEGINVASTDAMLDNAMLWLDHYCRTNAFSTMQEGLMQLVRELSAKSKARQGRR